MPESFRGELLPQPADRTIHRGDFRVTFAQYLALRPPGRSARFVGGQADLLGVFRGQVVVEGEILGQAAVRFGRRAKPDHGQEWFS